MQQTALDKEQQKAWLNQLVITKLNDDYIEEALELVVESTTSLYDIFNELNVSKDTCREAFRSDFEDKLNQQNSMVIIDPSSNNKIVSARIFRDLTKIDQTPPKKENYTCPGYFLKAQLNNELMQGVYCKDFKEKDYEVTIVNNVHPDFANRGLLNYVNRLYGKDTYMRGIKKTVNLVFSSVVLKVMTRYTGGNPTVLKEINLENRELDGKKVFEKSNQAYLLTVDITDELLKSVGYDIEELKKEKEQMQQQ